MFYVRSMLKPLVGTNSDIPAVSTLCMFADKVFANVSLVLLDIFQVEVFQNRNSTARIVEIQLLL